MSHFTAEQRQAFVSLAQTYAHAVHAVVSGRDGAPTKVRSAEVVALLDEFADAVLAIVARDSHEPTNAREACLADADLSA